VDWYGTPFEVLAIDEGNDTLRRSKAEHILRYQQGRPCSYLTVSACKRLFGPKLGSEFVLANDILAWITGDRRSIKVYNLRTGNSWTEQVPTRESIHHLSASPELLAFVTYKYCFVRTLSGDTRKQFRLQSPSKCSVTCRGRIVSHALFPEFDPSLEREFVSVYVWDFDSNSGQSVKILLDEER
jgi:hypothetical protein